MCHQLIPVWYRSVTTEQLEIRGHVYLVQWSKKQNPWNYWRSGLESPYGEVQCRLTSLVPKHFSCGTADLCWRKEPCWVFIASGAMPECLYPASGHWPVSSCSVPLTHPLPFYWWENAGRPLLAPCLPHLNWEDLLDDWEVSLSPLSPCPIHYRQNCPPLVISFLCNHFFCKQWI